jgi:hypothetical protein
MKRLFMLPQIGVWLVVYLAVASHFDAMFGPIGVVALALVAAGVFYYFWSSNDDES